MAAFVSPEDIGELTPEAESRRAEITTRQKAIKHHIIIALMAAVGSCLSIIVGIVIVCKGDNGSWPINTWSPIWSGAFVLMQVFFTFSIKCTDASWSSDSSSSPHGDKGKQRCLLSVTYWLAMTTSAFSTSASAVFTIVGAVGCKRKDAQMCGTNLKMQLVLNIIGAILGIFLFVLSVLTCIMCCYHRKAFHFYSMDDRLKHFKRTGQVLVE